MFHFNAFLTFEQVSIFYRPKSNIYFTIFNVTMNPFVSASKNISQCFK